MGSLTRCVPRPSVFSMRAAGFQGVGRSRAIQDVPDPEPGPSKLVLAVRDCGIFTIDMVARGRIDASPILSETASRDSFPAAFEALRTDKSRVKVILEPR